MGPLTHSLIRISSLYTLCSLPIYPFTHPLLTGNQTHASACNPTHACQNKAKITHPLAHKPTGPPTRPPALHTALHVCGHDGARAQRLRVKGSCTRISRQQMQVPIASPKQYAAEGI